jgi:vibriolysin
MKTCVQTRPYTLTVVAAFVLSACGGDGDPQAEILTEPVSHYEEDNALAGGDLERAAVEYVRGFDEELGLSSDDDLTLLSVRSGGDGLRHARLQQEHRGVPVFGSQVAVHADESTFLGFNGTLTRNLSGFDVEPSISGDDAMAIAKQDHSGGSPDEIQYSREAETLVILPRGARGADLVWHVEFFNEVEPGIAPGRWNYFVDAGTGDVRKRYDALTTLDQASGPGGNARVSRTWNAVLDVESGGEGFVMETDRLVTIDMENQEDAWYAPWRDGTVATAGGLDGFDDPAANDAHGFTEVTLDMMRDWMGVDSIDDEGFVIISRVHYGVDHDVAFWNGEFTTYGDSDPAVRYPRSGALDIVAHEIHHGFTEKHSELEYEGMSGGLNESFSDIAGTLAEYFHEGDRADLIIGEDIYIAEGGMHRSMCDPPADGSSIDNAADYTDGIDVHYSSGVSNKAFCLAVDKIAAASPSGTSRQATVRRVAQVWYTANASYWTSKTDFEQGCQGVIDAARALGFSRAEVDHLHQSWLDVGVACQGAALVCNANDECDVGDGETCVSCSEDCGSCDEGCGFWKKAKCKIGIGDCSRCGEPGCGDGICTDDENADNCSEDCSNTPAGCGDGECAQDENDSNCGQDCGCSAPDSCGSVAPYGCYCDDSCGETGDCCADIGVCS